MTPEESHRSVLASVQLPTVVPGGGFDRAVSLNVASIDSELSPFVDVTLFDMSQPVFRPHPHAGFSAVTYMFEDSPGAFRNRWTAGQDELIGAGAIHWTRAGSGMLHEEVPTEPSVTCLGLQMFVKLDPAHELDAPQAFHLDSNEIDEVTLPDGGRIRVLVGRHADVTSSLGLPDPITFLDVHLPPGGAVEIPAPSSWNAFVLVRRGSIEIAGVVAAAASAATFEHDGDAIVVRSDQGAQFLFGTGAHAGPQFSRGSFILSSRERLDDAERRFRAGAMGRLVPSF